MAFHDFPETGWSAAIDCVVAVVVRPNTILRNAEHLPFEDPKPEAKGHVEVVRENRFDVLSREVIGKSGLPGPDSKNGHVAEQRRGVHHLERVPIGCK
jgi:hypothetical protein